MVILKTQSNAPLETIYEESGSFVASTVSMQHPFNHHTRPNGTYNGLISARSIPSVGFQRQRESSNQHRPPVEVQFRDGSKRYIQSKKAAAMMMNRRNLPTSSQKKSSSRLIPHSNHQQIFSPNFNHTKLPIVLTIITADDLEQAGITPTLSSSPDESPRPISTLTQSQSASSNDTIKAKRNIHRVSFAPLPTTPTQPSIHSVSNHSTPNPRSSSSLSQLSQEQQLITNQPQRTTPLQSLLIDSNLQPSIPSPKPPQTSLVIPLTNEEINRNILLESNLSTIFPSSDEPVRQTAALIGGGTHSAFRPVSKQISLNHTSLPVATRPLFVTNRNVHKPFQQQQPQQQQQTFPHNSFYSQRYPSNITQISVQSTTIPGKLAIPKQVVVDIATKPLSSFKTLTQMNSSNYAQQSIPVPLNSNKPIPLPNLLKMSPASAQNFSFAVSPSTKWCNITSNISDIPRLSRRYSGIPLRITLPVLTPTHNQKLVISHNTALETRLLNAGLSPETIALYERILDVAESRPVPILSPPKLIDSIAYSSLE